MQENINSNYTKCFFIVKFHSENKSVTYTQFSALSSTDHHKKKAKQYCHVQQNEIDGAQKCVHINKLFITHHTHYMKLLLHTFSEKKYTIMKWKTGLNT